MAKFPHESVYKKLTPPYLSFQKFYVFLKKIEKNYTPGGVFIPDQALKDYSEEDQRLLLRALDFFHLLQADKVMTAAMQVYLQGSGVSQQMAMREWIKTSYSPDLFRAIAEKDGEAIAAAFPENLSTTVRNRCLAFLRNFARAVDLDLSTVQTGGLNSLVQELAQGSFPVWIETILALDWGRFCILKHDGPLSAGDVERIKKGLDMLVGRLETGKTGVVVIGESEHQREGVLRLDVQVTEGDFSYQGVALVVNEDPLEVQWAGKGKIMPSLSLVHEAVREYLGRGYMSKKEFVRLVEQLVVKEGRISGSLTLGGKVPFLCIDNRTKEELIAHLERNNPHQDPPDVRPLSNGMWVAVPRSDNWRRERAKQLLEALGLNPDNYLFAEC